MTAADLLASVSSDPTPPSDLPPLAKALWLAKKGDWDAAHNIAQDVHSTDGSWVHALLHLIEGDSGNAAYWFARANRPTVPSSAIDAEWLRIARHLCGG